MQCLGKKIQIEQNMRQKLNYLGYITAFKGLSFEENVRNFLKDFSNGDMTCVSLMH